MLEFTCPDCGKRVQGDRAGPQRQCPGCGSVGTNSTTIAPGLAPLPDRPSRAEMPTLIARWATWVAMTAMALVLAGVLVKGIQIARDAAARAQSTNNLEQIGLAFHSFHDTHKRLPFNGTQAAVAGDMTTGSWAFMILPYLDQNAVFAAKDTSTGVATYMCPGRGRPSLCTGDGGPGAWTDYYLNSFINDPNGLTNVPDIKRTLVSISDGSSNTILVGHGQINPDAYSSIHAKTGFTDVIFNGGSPGLCRPNRTVGVRRDSSDPPSRAGNWGGPFIQGALMCLGDATVRMYPYSMPTGVIVDGVGKGPESAFSTILTPNGGESMTLE